MKTYMLEYLTEVSVTVVVNRTIELDGEVISLPPHVCTYDNTEDSRGRLVTDLPEPYLSAILTVWGDDVIPYEVTMDKQEKEMEE